MIAKRKTKAHLENIEIQLLIMPFPFWGKSSNDITPLFFGSLLMMIGLAGYEDSTTVLDFDTMFNEFSRLMEPSFLEVNEQLPQ